MGDVANNGGGRKGGGRFEKECKGNVFSTAVFVVFNTVMNDLFGLQIERWCRAS